MQKSVERHPKRNDRTFLLVLGSFGVLIILSLLCLGIVVFCGINKQCPVLPAVTTKAPITVTIQPPTITMTTDTPITVTIQPPTITMTTDIPVITPSPTKGPFDPFPEEYKNIQLPQLANDALTQGGVLDPLPIESGLLQEKLKLAAKGHDLSSFDLGRIVNDANNEYISVPISPDYFKKHFGVNEDFRTGTLVGLIFDEKGAYDGIPDTYEIWAYDEFISLTSPRLGKAIILRKDLGEYDWISQDTSSDLPLTVFINFLVGLGRDPSPSTPSHLGKLFFSLRSPWFPDQTPESLLIKGKKNCTLCWRADGRCGCLLCKKK